MPEFATIARRQQGEFRQSSHTISLSARQPSDDRGLRHAHLLAVGSEEENLFPPLRGPDGASAFFLDRGIQWWKSERSGDDFRIKGPTRNLASSQVACVNFILPLAASQNLATALLKALEPSVTRAVQIAYHRDTVKLSSFIELEWVGLTTSLEVTNPSVRGANATSADALLIAELPSGARRAYLIEWKFVEEYEAEDDLGEGSSGKTRRLRYTERFNSPSSPFSSDQAVDEWLYEPFYQIMRLLLLGQKMVDEAELGVSEATVAVVCPEENTAYRNRITSPGLHKRYPAASGVLDVVHSAVRDPSRFLLLSQLELIRSLATTRDPSIAAWLAYHQERYGWDPMPGA